MAQLGDGLAANAVGVTRNMVERFVDLARQRLGTVIAVRLAAHAIDLLHNVSGMHALPPGLGPRPVLGDVHTMTQHIILSTTGFETAGRLLLGLDPDSAIMAF